MRRIDGKRGGTNGFFYSKTLQSARGGVAAGRGARSINGYFSLKAIQGG